MFMIMCEIILSELALQVTLKSMCVCVCTSVGQRETDTDTERNAKLKKINITE